MSHHQHKAVTDPTVPLTGVQPYVAQAVPVQIPTATGPVPVAPGQVVNAIPVVDPRPPLKMDNEVHDFEVHREGGYAKGHTFKGHHPRPAAILTGGGVDSAHGGHRTELREDRYIDPRPPLKMGHEVHDYEVHREGGYAKGHTFKGARAEGAGVITPTGAEGVPVSGEGRHIWGNVTHPYTHATKGHVPHHGSKGAAHSGATHHADTAHTGTAYPGASYGTINPADRV